MTEKVAIALKEVAGNHTVHMIINRCKIIFILLAFAILIPSCCGLGIKNFKNGSHSTTFKEGKIPLVLDVSFEDGFNNDTISVVVNGQKLINNIIFTTPDEFNSYGFAFLANDSAIVVFPGYRNKFFANFAKNKPKFFISISINSEQHNICVSIKNGKYVSISLIGCRRRWHNSYMKYNLCVYQSTTPLPYE